MLLRKLNRLPNCHFPDNGFRDSIPSVFNNGKEVVQCRVGLLRQRLLFDSAGSCWSNLLATPGFAPGFELGLPFHSALVQTNPERLVWGSDWPHLRVTPVPDAGVLLETFKRWTANDELVQRILTHNPGALYA